MELLWDSRETQTGVAQERQKWFWSQSGERRSDQVYQLWPSFRLQKYFDADSESLVKTMKGDKYLNNKKLFLTFVSFYCRLRLLKFWGDDEIWLSYNQVTINFLILVIMVLLSESAN